MRSRGRQSPRELAGIGLHALWNRDPGLLEALGRTWYVCLGLAGLVILRQLFRRPPASPRGAVIARPA